jgi:hypothetical protein
MQYMKSLLLLAGMVVALGVVDASAAQKQMTKPAVQVKQGEKVMLEELFAWDKNCRRVNVSFKAIKSPNGRLFASGDTFKIRTVPGDRCRGKSVAGKGVYFQPARGFKGRTTVQFLVSSPNMADSYVISVPVRVL